jgi:hypothetical protein
VGLGFWVVCWAGGLDGGFYTSFNSTNIYWLVFRGYDSCAVYTYRLENNSIVFDETIIAPHTATFSDSAIAIKRLRLANEGAGNKNIEAFLEKLSALNIDKNEISVSE